jgi:uncharacterized membrane protein
MRALLGLLLLIAMGSHANAALKVCNKFKHPIRLATAIPTVDGWVSRGWTTIKPDACEIDPKLADLTGFYYYAETDPIPTEGGKTTTWTWGNKRSFAVKNGDFAFQNAETKPKGGRLVEFSGPFQLNHASTVATLTLEEGSSSFEVPKEDRNGVDDDDDDIDDVEPPSK